MPGEREEAHPDGQSILRFTRKWLNALALQTQQRDAHMWVILQNLPSGPSVSHKPTTQTEQNAATASVPPANPPPKLPPSHHRGRWGSGHRLRASGSRPLRSHAVTSHFLRDQIPRLLGRAHALKTHLSQHAFHPGDQVTDSSSETLSESREHARKSQDPPELPR